jgi:hypothetical protein
MKTLLRSSGISNCTGEPSPNSQITLSRKILAHPQVESEFRKIIGSHSRLSDSWVRKEEGSSSLTHLRMTT